jgi:hypothetical protein
MSDIIDKEFKFLGFGISISCRFIEGNNGRKTIRLFLGFWQGRSRICLERDYYWEV